MLCHEDVLEGVLKQKERMVGGSYAQEDLRSHNGHHGKFVQAGTSLAYTVFIPF